VAPVVGDVVRIVVVVVWVVVIKGVVVVVGEVAVEVVVRVGMMRTVVVFSDVVSAVPDSVVWLVSVGVTVVVLVKMFRQPKVPNIKKDIKAKTRILRRYVFNR